MANQIKEKFHELYIYNHTFNENEIQKENASFYEQVIDEYGTWQKGLKANGVSKKRLKERERFQLYWILKKRFEKYGEKALRPKNIDPITKDRIVEVYKTMKNLNRIIKSWDEDKVLYETRAYLVSGDEVGELKYEHPKLYQQIIKHFDDVDGFYEEYYNRFGFDMNGVTNKTEEKINDNDENLKLRNMLIQLGEYTEEEVSTMIEASEKTKDDVILYLMEELLLAKRKGEYPTEEKIKEKNMVMYYAMRAQFGTFRNALNEITNTFAAQG